MSLIENHFSTLSRTYSHGANQVHLIVKLLLRSAVWPPMGDLLSTPDRKAASALNDEIVDLPLTAREVADERLPAFERMLDRDRRAGVRRELVADGLRRSFEFLESPLRLSLTLDAPKVPQGAADFLLDGLDAVEFPLSPVFVIR